MSGCDQPEGWTLCAREGCVFVAFAGSALCPEHAADVGRCDHVIEWDLAGVEARCKGCKRPWPCPDSPDGDMKRSGQ